MKDHSVLEFSSDNTLQKKISQHVYELTIGIVFTGCESEIFPALGNNAASGDVTVDDVAVFEDVDTEDVGATDAVVVKFVDEESEVALARAAGGCVCNRLSGVVGTFGTVFAPPELNTAGRFALVPVGDVIKELTVPVGNTASEDKVVEFDDACAEAVPGVNVCGSVTLGCRFAL